MKAEFYKPLEAKRFEELAAQIQNPDDSLVLRAAKRLKLFLEEERIIKVQGTRIPAWRTITEFPDIYAAGEKKRLQAGHFVHEQGRVCNISSDWQGVLESGLIPRRAKAEENLKNGIGEAEFLKAAILTIDAVVAYADRYEIPTLSRAIRYGASHFEDALQTMRILHFALWASNVYHNTIGRFDQYMWPYLKKDLENGILTEQEALELLEEFFLSFNRDSALYTGMQQGDNGQSLMLGGCDAQGNCTVNKLTFLCLDASLHNRTIDPKINLRVDRNTSMELYEKATMLTRQGLGFPQYSNDDVVIPALVRFGYSLEDARNYTVAACWEFIIPGVGMDIPNISAVCLATATDECIRKHLKECRNFEQLLDAVNEELRRRAVATAASVGNLWMEPAPYQSVLMDGCIERGFDISQGAKYNNYGIHGTGVSDAVDQLAAMNDLIFEHRKMTAEDFLLALENNFANNADLLNYLRTQTPKMGRNYEVEPIAEAVLNAFADAFAGLKNERGGIFRPGTGSAMYYVWHAKNAGMLADGHKPGENFAANFSPSLLVTDAGLLSVVKGFSCKALPRVCNGGPLTLELHDTVFRNNDGMKKVAQLVRTFILLGGHQLQLNAVSRETLLDAKKHPERHQDLIVRVWGWSGRFVRLNPEYQDQIIARTSYQSV